MVYDFLLTQQSWKPRHSQAASFFISIFLLPGTLLTGGLPSQLEIAIEVQRVCNLQCGPRPTVQPLECCFFIWTHSKCFLKVFVSCCENWLQSRLCPVNMVTGLLASNNRSFIAMSSWNDPMLVISQANFLWIVFSSDLFLIKTLLGTQWAS